MNKLEEQQAYYGVSVDPSVQLEIEDIEERIGQLHAQLEQLRSTEETGEWRLPDWLQERNESGSVIEDEEISTLLPSLSALIPNPKLSKSNE